MERFFKTGPGEYGEGDVFWGLFVPEVRKIALNHKDISLREVERLLAHKVHEVRQAGLEILVARYPEDSETIYAFFMEHLSGVNNWDLVDTTAPDIVGTHLLTRKRDILDRLAESSNMWERRIAIVATLTFIQDGQLKDTFRICTTLMQDDEDLLHKAMGWMLREAWKQDARKTEAFLKKHIRALPRTTLRYAIERMDEPKRKRFLSL